MLIVSAAAQTAAQDAARLWLGEPDLSAFPLVRIPLFTADAQGAPLADFSRLSLRENGIPLELTVTNEPAGLDVTFVLDANAEFEMDDAGDGLTRRAKTADSISQFAARFMSRDGLDRVSALVPDAAGINGRYLIQNSDSPDIAAQTITAYKPATTSEPPLQAMLTLAIEQMARNEDGRFQAILLFSDGGRSFSSLDTAALVEQAQAAQIPIYAAILGAQADANEISNVTRLTEPTGGGYAAMPTAGSAEPIYLAWQGHANRQFIEYQSLQTQNGRYPITVNLGSIRAATELVLALAAPEIAIQMPVSEIQRVGSAYDTPLAELTPTNTAVPIQISWPDGVPRPLTAVTLYVAGPDGQTKITTEAQPDAAGQLSVPWDLQLLREGGYQLAVQVADGYGYAAESAPANVIIRTERPDPPTPTPLPPPTPVTTPEPTPAIATERLLLALGLSLAAGLAAAMMLWRRWRARQRRGGAGEQGSEEVISPLANLPPATLQTRLPAYLDDDGLPLPLTNDNVTIGRDETAVTLTLNDKSVARLHARIRWRDGRYWLYDEGSAAGTRLNFERLGLAPHPLQDGDQIQIGRLRLYFRLGEFEEEE